MAALTNLSSETATPASGTMCIVLLHPKSLGSPSRALLGNDPSEVQSLKKSLNRFGAKAVYTAVLVIDRCPNHPWIALVSCPLLARA
jgi:hypothetical protein